MSQQTQTVRQDGTALAELVLDLWIFSIKQFKESKENLES